jgi:hypothetical protein
VIKRLVAAFQHHPAGLEDIAVIAGFERLGDALLDEQQSDPVLAVERRDALKDQIRDRRSQAHGRLVEQQQLRRGGDAAADRQHLLLAAGQRAGELVTTFREHRKKGEDAI